MPTPLHPSLRSSPSAQSTGYGDGGREKLQGESSKVLVQGHASTSTMEYMSQKLDIPWIKSPLFQFPCGEWALRAMPPLVGMEVLLVQDFLYPDALMSLGLLTTALAEAKVKKTVVVTPYLPYGRQNSHHRNSDVDKETSHGDSSNVDRENSWGQGGLRKGELGALLVGENQRKGDQKTPSEKGDLENLKHPDLQDLGCPGQEPFSLDRGRGCKVFRGFLNTLPIHTLITLDPHGPTAMDSWSFPTIFLSSWDIFSPNKTLQKSLSTIHWVVSPDQGGLCRAQVWAEKLGLPCLALEKKRHAQDLEVTYPCPEIFKDKHCLLVDDILDTGHTLAKATAYLLQHGAKGVSACITHALCSLGCWERIKSCGLRDLWISDSVFGCVKISASMGSAERLWDGKGILEYLQQGKTEQGESCGSSLGIHAVAWERGMVRSLQGRNVFS